ncbi:outer membrane beta-barrel protein [Candidatus Thiothrix sp. Deng01]|uniref:Outer membrane beta-barrel protein n=1 Tax=Candidatus Thiothrix phosphatis TaxID=3112415 RepID=A0ABU6D1S9_9GAMM|nr:outer membrane beta-barrel protein [Candidatus Thiothrix sp. Deng01]MEB4593022.1 outer membrane beta-barrel protein [Candidatus Thiothrix sp. Deng01]
MKRSLLLGLFSLAMAPHIVLAEDLFASDQEEPGQFYAGYSLLKSEAGCNFQGVECDSSGWKLLGGYKFNDNIAVEGGYYNIFNNDGTDATTGKEAVVKGTGIAMSTIGSYSINDTTSLTGKVGLMAWRAEADLAGTRTSAMDGTDVLSGVGVGYKLNDNWQVRGEYEHVGGDLDANMYSAGATLSTL